MRNPASSPDRPLGRPADAPHGRLVGGIVAIALAGWAFLAWLTLDMGHPFAQLTMPATSRWKLANTAAIAVMWTVMMAAMMLPSALPMIRSFVQLSLRAGETARGAAFVAAYLLVWGGIGLAAVAVQWLLQALGGVDAMVVSRSAGLSAALLLLAGAWQFSPLKKVCLARCRTPLAFLLGEWRPGLRGGFAMGLRHGLYCAGCCWALMALLFVGGAMNLAWMAALAIAVAIEKLAPHGERIGVLLGVLLLGAGAVRLWQLATLS